MPSPRRVVETALPTAEQEQWANANAEFEDVIVHQRDALANQALADVYAKHQQHKMHVAIV